MREVTEADSVEGERKAWTCGQCTPRVYFDEEEELTQHMRKRHPSLERCNGRWYSLERKP